MRQLTVLSICVALVFCVSFASSAVASDEEDVLEVANNWAKAFNTSDFELMSSIYLHSPKTSEFGPVEGYPFLSQGWDLLEEAWTSNLSVPAGTYMFSLHNPQVTMVGKDAAVTTVYQIVVYTDSETNEQNILQIRQTLVLQKTDGKWFIVHHHSSNFQTE